MKKIILFILVGSVILTPVLWACGADNDGGADKPPDVPAEENSGDETVGGEENPEDGGQAEIIKILPDLPDMDFEGYEFTVLSRVNGGPDWTEWAPRDIYAEEENSDLVNDAVYRRNRAAEAKYNFTVKEFAPSGGFDGALSKAIKANDGAYDVVCPGLRDTFATQAQRGWLLDLFEVAYIDFSKPWWNQEAPSQLSICGRLYGNFSDMLVLHKDSTEAMIFNKKLLAELNLESPYALVRDGKWTMDKLLEFTKAGKKDLDGDGEMKTEDQFGLVAQLDSITSWVHGAGMTFGSLDANGYPVDNFPENRRLYEVIEKSFELMYDDGTINLHHYEGKFPIYDYQRKMFAENRGLVSWIRMRIVETLRAMETDFGIIPVPKYDAAQEKYYSSINPYTSCTIAVPASCSDPDRAGFIIEALSAESRYTLSPAYYDLTLKGKHSRDNDSEEMLDIIFSSTIFDVMEIYNFGNFVREYIDLFRKKTQSEYISLYEKRLDKIYKDIEKCVDTFANID